MTQVWVVVTTKVNGAGEQLRVVSDTRKAHDIVEQCAVDNDVQLLEGGGVEWAADPHTGRIVWFDDSTGTGVAARVEGPFTVDGDLG